VTRRVAAIALLATSALASALPRSAIAHVVSDRELRVVAQFPAGAVRRMFADCAPDAAGNVPPNRSEAWLGAGHQRPAMLRLLEAAARSDTLDAERCWLAFDAAFAQQLPGGGFRRSAAPAARAIDDSLTDATAWAACASRAMIAVMNSGLADRFRWRYALLKPKLQRAVDFVEARSDSLVAAHARHSAALLTAAAALLLADGMYHDERYGRAGQRAMVAALALQRPDGAFPTDGRADPASHALALEALQSIAIYFPSPTLERSASRAAAWLRAKRPSATGDAAFVLRYAAIKPPPPLGGIHPVGD